MTEIWKSISDVATNAYDGAKEQLHDHPLLCEALGIGAAVVGAVTFRGKLAGLLSSAKTLCKEGEEFEPAVKKLVNEQPLIARAVRGDHPSIPHIEIVRMAPGDPPPPEYHDPERMGIANLVPAAVKPGSSRFNIEAANKQRRFFEARAQMLRGGNTEVGPTADGQH